MENQAEFNQESNVQRGDAPKKKKCIYIYIYIYITADSTVSAFWNLESSV